MLIVITLSMFTVASGTVLNIIGLLLGIFCLFDACLNYRTVRTMFPIQSAVVFAGILVGSLLHVIGWSSWLIFNVLNPSLSTEVNIVGIIAPFSAIGFNTAVLVLYICHSTPDSAD